MTLPSFPVDDATLDLLQAAITGTSGEDGRSSVLDLCRMYSELGGSDTDAVEAEEHGVAVARDVDYGPNDIIAALVAEIRTLRSSR